MLVNSEVTCLNWFLELRDVSSLVWIACLDVSALAAETSFWTLLSFLVADLRQVLGIETSGVHHFWIVVKHVWLDLRKNLLVSLGDVTNVDWQVSLLEWHRNSSASMASQGSDCLLTIDAISTLFNHSCWNSCTLVWCCSVWE